MREAADHYPVNVGMLVYAVIITCISCGLRVRVVLMLKLLYPKSTKLSETRLVSTCARLLPVSVLTVCLHLRGGRADKE